MSEPGIEVPVLLLSPRQPARGLVMAVNDAGKEESAADPVLRDLLESGWAVAGIDPRGIGELSVDKPNWVFASTLLLGQNFVWLQTWDLVRSLQVIGAAAAFKNKPVGLYARGHNAALAVTYMIGQAAGKTGIQPRWFVLQEGFLSYRQFIDRPESMQASFKLGTEEADRRKRVDREIPGIYLPFQVLLHFNMPQLLERTNAKGLVVNPIDGDWKFLAEEKARALVPSGVRVVTGPQADEQVRTILKPWL